MVWVRPDQRVPIVWSGRLIYHGLLSIARYFAQSEIALLLPVARLMNRQARSLPQEGLAPGVGPKIVSLGSGKGSAQIM
jgi:hypothetical protein